MRFLLAALAAAMALPARARAEPAGSPLLLPLLAALAITRSAIELHATPTPEVGGLGAVLPERLHIPNLYAIDLDRDPPRFAEPIDRDKYVSLDLLPRRLRGTMISLSYDGESAPIGEGSNLVRFVLEYRF